MLQWKCSVVLAAVVAIAGCAGSPGDDLPAFGETVTAIKEAQTWNEGDAVPTMNGDRGTRSMEAYRNRGAEQGSRAAGVSVD
jgi:hypothetical protein